MGLLILDDITLSNFGITINNIIATFEGNYNLTSRVDNGVKKYYLSGQLSFFKERDKSCIKRDFKNYLLTEEELSGNLLTYMYNRVKTEYSNTQDI